ncbi:hypothetical protein Tco_0500430 [Tanacetum coccineum]
MKINSPRRNTMDDTLYKWLNWTRNQLTRVVTRSHLCAQDHQQTTFETSTVAYPQKNQTKLPLPRQSGRGKLVTCGGASFLPKVVPPRPTGNVYRDNIQEYVSQAATPNFNQRNTGYRASIAKQIRPPGFPPVQQKQGNNQNCYNQNWGNNYNQGQICRPPINQPPVHQAPHYQAPAPQTQGVTKNDFESYVKANDAVMRNMQDQNQNLQNQMTNLMDMLSKFMNSNTASTSGSGTLPSDTITNPKVDLKGITTQSSIAYQGPTIPTTTSSPTKIVEPETEVTKCNTPIFTYSSIS